MAPALPLPVLLTVDTDAFTLLISLSWCLSQAGITLVYVQIWCDSWMMIKNR